MSLTPDHRFDTLAPPSPAAPTPFENLGRRERKKLATRNAILDAALTLMSKSGYDGVTVSDICQSADIANATFFAHFPSKSALITEFNSKITARIAAQLKSFSGTPAEQLQFLSAQLIEEWKDQIEVLQGLVTDIASGRSRPVPFTEANQSLIHLTTKIIDDAQKCGEFPSDIPAETVSLTLVSGWSTVVMNLTKDWDRDQVLKGHQDVLTLVLRGLGKA